MENSFAILNKINVNEHIEKKGAFSYLSWPWAVQQLRLADPSATWEVKRFNGLPYLQTDLGFFVEVSVSVQGVPLSQIHPVLDGKNHPIAIPSSFDINTSIQRCLVKAIALHGLGLYVYAGEDLPEVPAIADKPATPDAPKLMPAAVGGSISHEQAAQIKVLLGQAGMSLQRLLTFFRVNSLAEIKSADYPRVVSTLENAKRRAA